VVVGVVAEQPATRLVVVAVLVVTVLTTLHLGQSLLQNFLAVADRLNLL
jgi:hypothetical protein